MPAPPSVAGRARRRLANGNRRCNQWGQVKIQRPAPVEEWITIPVPAIVSQETFDLAQKRLDENKQMARRNNRAHDYLLRGLVSCDGRQLAAVSKKSLHARRTPLRRRVVVSLGSNDLMGAYFSVVMFSLSHFG
jgi:hypothetical protein